VEGGAGEMIELTSIYHGEKIYLNPTEISSMEVSDSNGRPTWIKMRNKTTYYVRETPTKINGLIEEAHKL
jgi:hypothetical protein